jgi:hypothetical protein
MAVKLVVSEALIVELHFIRCRRNYNETAFRLHRAHRNRILDPGCIWGEGLRLDGKDILNLVGEEYSKTKGQVGEDIHEGKLSLIVLHALRNLDRHESARLAKILGLKTNDATLIDEVRSVCACV